MEMSNTTRRVDETRQVEAEKSIRKAINDVCNLFADKEDERFLLAMDNLHWAFEQVGNYVDEYEHEPPSSGLDPVLVEKEIRKHAKGQRGKLYVELGFRTYSELEIHIIENSQISVADFNIKDLGDGNACYRVYGCDIVLRRDKTRRDHFRIHSIDMVEKPIQFDINSLKRQ